MKRTLSSRIRLLSRAAIFSVLAIGGMSLGLGATTYTVTLANDYVVASFNGDAPASTVASEPKMCR